MTTDLPTLAIVITSDTVNTSTIALIKEHTGRSLAEIRSEISKKRPVVVTDMFSDEYYDGGADRLVSLIDALENADVSFDIFEIEEGKNYDTADLDVSKISAEIFRNIVASSHETRDAFDE